MRSTDTHNVLLFGRVYEVSKAALKATMDSRHVSIKRGKASKYVGVFRAGSKWKAQLQHKNRSIYLGCFETEEEAAQVYQIEKAKITTSVMEGQLRNVSFSDNSLKNNQSQGANLEPPLKQTCRTHMNVDSRQYYHRHTVPTTSSLSQASSDTGVAGNGLSFQSHRVLLMVEIEKVHELEERIRLGERLSTSNTSRSPRSI